MNRATPIARDAYRHHQTITTRWMDNDAYGHVNNIVYYSWFDTVVNEFMIHHGQLDIGKGAAIGLVIESQCTYFSSVAFPDVVTAGLRVASVGRSSVRYEIGIFRGTDMAPSAQGHLVHVFVDRETRTSTPLPAPLRSLLETIHTGATTHD